MNGWRTIFGGAAGLVIASCLTLAAPAEEATEATAAGGLTASVGSTGKSSPTKPRWLLREGTRVGPITGRFSRIGQDWRFIPDAADDSISDRVDSRLVAVSEVRAGVLSRRLPSSGDLESDEVKRFTTGSSSPGSIGSAAKGVANPTRVVEALSMVPVIENLMLQRIAQAMDEDPSDSRWTITGSVTEYREENRLILATIQRAPVVLD